MMATLEGIWHYLVAALGLVVWAIRVEGRVKVTAEDLAQARIEARAELAALERRLADQRREDLEAAKESRQTVTDALVVLRDGQNVLHGDVKRILEKLGARG